MPYLGVFIPPIGDIATFQAKVDICKCGTKCLIWLFYAGI